MTAVYLAAGTPVNNLNWVSGSTGNAAATHWWHGLYDNNRNQLAVTADQGAVAITSNTTYTLAVATTAAGAAASFTATYSGLYYVGHAEVTGTAALGFGPTSTVGGEVLLGIGPILSGTSDSVTVGPPSFPHQATTLTAIEEWYVGTS
jgi:hypothetical protein